MVYAQAKAVIAILFVTLFHEGHSAASGHIIRIENRCSEDIWVGILGGPKVPEDGGFLLISNHQKKVFVPQSWSGRIWGRTGCDQLGRSCDSGDCGDLHCSGRGGDPPATLAEITFGDRSVNNLDFYDISLVDGYNLPMSMEPMPQANNQQTSNSCGRAGCNYDLNMHCPKELAKTNKLGKVVACNSACNIFDTDQFCCRGAFGNVATCKPFPYSEIFKKACPMAYSYAYDDASSVFRCRTAKPEPVGYSLSHYIIKFCPGTILKEPLISEEM